MDGNPTTDTVRSLIAQRLQIDVPAPDLDLIDGGVLDSLALVELLVELERSFGIELALEDFDIEDFRTPTSIASFVARQVSDAGEAA